MKKCLVCSNPITPFISFGKQPIANGFLNRDSFANEYFFSMDVAFCDKCKMVQLTEQPEREKMFHESYPFFSSLSANMQKHFSAFAETLTQNYLKVNPFVVEMGSNDGIMLINFKNKGIKCLGVEPSRNVAEVAITKGIPTVIEFFDEDLAKRIVAEHGKADVFCTSNVFCHIPYTHSVIKGIDALLKPEGVIAFEDPYLGEIVRNTTYDQIYDEHVFFFSVHSVQNLFAPHGFEVIKVEPQETHGGSMRYYLARKGMRPIDASVAKILAEEKELGLDRKETYDKFAENVKKLSNDLVTTLKEIKKEGKRVVGYAATSKSTTILNFCGIGPDLIEYICDTTPLKQGKFSPGMHIPVKPYALFKEDKPDYALLFAYNHRKEIASKESDFKGKWILYPTKLEVLNQL